MNGASENVTTTPPTLESVVPHLTAAIGANVILAVVIVATILAVFLIDMVQSRLQRDRFINSNPRLWKLQLAFILFVSLGAVLLYTFTGRLDTIIAVFFGVISLEVAVYFSLKPSFERKTVCIISKSNNNFARGVVTACRERLATEPGLIVREISLSLPSAFDEDAHHQERALSSRQALDADAIMIIPSMTTNSLIDHIVHFRALGIYCLVCDHKLPNQVFFENGLFPPSLVTSDFLGGGRMLGIEMANRISGVNDVVVILTGPPFSAPGVIRSNACISELTRIGKQNHLRLIELESWHPHKSATLFLTHAKSLLHDVLQRAGTARVHVFCGNDEICREVSQKLARDTEISSHNWHLFGYDGIKDNSGTYVLESCPYVVGTIDQHIDEIGTQSANILIEKFRGMTTVSRKKVVIKQKFVAFDGWRATSKNRNNVHVDKGQ